MLKLEEAGGITQYFLNDLRFNELLDNFSIGDLIGKKESQNEGYIVFVYPFTIVLI